MKREQYEDKELDGKVFRIHKFTPDVASYWGFKLFGDLAAFGLSMGGTDEIKDKLPRLIKDFTEMPRKQFAEFQKDCLSFVSVRFDLAGFKPLVNSEGYFTVTDISNPTLLQLTTDSFMFTISDFFAQWLQDGKSLEPGVQSGPTSSPETGSVNSATTP